MSDDSSSTSRFAKLNDSNYAAWSMHMEAELIRKELWTDVVEVMIDQVDDKGKPRKQEDIEADTTKRLNARLMTKMAQARAEMILRVEPGQLSHMHSKDPLVVWEDLKAVHRARGFAAFLSLKRKFLTMKKEKGQKMSAWIGEVKSQVFEMEEAGLMVPDLDIILALTMGLPSSYDSLIINFNDTPSSDLTLNHVMTRLLAEETRQLTHTIPTPQTTITTNAKDLLHNVALSDNKTSLPVEQITCWFCDEKGHYKENCEKRKAWLESKKGNAMMVEDVDYVY
ncbi:hypothetical protein D9758_003799 [Tetrapyrgos nigripes]|uniref:CCHC-type domain-containing protein n=1 Tax=Tetrapyrgos nigripes TaxID=182062 RepID=A0A8H5GM39_9AGAR|nr:hypothetical protein D9758_003799 [Tetrapyrgos nigripes]